LVIIFTYLLEHYLHTHILNHNFEFKKKGQCGGYTATLLYVLD